MEHYFNAQIIILISCLIVFPFIYSFMAYCKNGVGKKETTFSSVIISNEEEKVKVINPLSLLRMTYEQKRKMLKNITHIQIESIKGKVSDILNPFTLNATRNFEEITIYPKYHIFQNISSSVKVEINKEYFENLRIGDSFFIGFTVEPASKMSIHFISVSNITYWQFLKSLFFK